ncbi:PRC-barrel domain-containing protein [Roseicella frigidaeris]|uniref:PRC-barrel domain-containing protein n=1 Tax=Roseicella frigidaeris TaxID=2230885 RepID=A0A327M3W6_9PROT|nr:PRC-barrel domain-containing protein [Roseicella frigidaeris]RAI57630.1 hypothetical protein DOO78_17690 [Roseicella frigidaeris]
MTTTRPRLAILAALAGLLAAPPVFAQGTSQGAGQGGGATGAGDSTSPALPGGTTSPALPGEAASPALPGGPSAAPNLARGSGAATPGSAFTVDTAGLRGGRRASKVVGSAVYNENNESVGEVDDLILPAAGGGPVAVISVGGFLGIGAKLVAVPYERLQVASGSGRWLLTGATKDSLGSLPTFTYDSIAEKKG